MKKTHLFLAMLLAGATSFSSLKAREVEIIKADSLVVNTDDTKRYVVQMGLEEGLLSLQDIVFENEFEEAWVYDPSGAHFDSNAVWIETGYEATGVKIGDPVMGDAPFYKQFVFNGAKNDMEFYLLPRIQAVIHYHPIKNTPAYMEARSNDNYALMNKKLTELKVNYALPSIHDLENIIFEIQSHPERKGVKYYIGAFSGITIYYPTQDGRDRFLKIYNPIGISKELKKILNSLRSSAASRLETMDDATAILNEAFNENSDKHFQIIFITYNELREKGLQ
jgi:hypothetical protein